MISSVAISCLLLVVMVSNAEGPKVHAFKPTIRERGRIQTNGGIPVTEKVCIEGNVKSCSELPINLAIELCTPFQTYGRRTFNWIRFDKEKAECTPLGRCKRILETQDDKFYGEFICANVQNSATPMIECVCAFNELDYNNYDENEVHQRR